MSPSKSITGLLFVGLCFVSQIPARAAEKLPRAEGYQADLVRWLGTIRIEDVQYEPAPLRYDGSYRTESELANLSIEMQAGRAYLDPNGEAGCKVLTAEAKWFVLDDGAGSGIEGTGAVRMFPHTVLASYWCQRDLPLAKGGQGNPCYHNAALVRRALVCTAVDMLMQDRDHDENEANARSDFLGGQLNAWAYTYLHGKPRLDAAGRATFEAGFSHMLDKVLRWGPRDVNTNMDIRVISSAAYVYLGASDARLQEKAVRTARRFLFGQEDGTLATLDSGFRKGLFNKAGYIAENQGAETTYNGVSLYHLLEAHAITRGDPRWEFLGDVVRKMLDFKLHNYFRDPDGRFDGPSGYANRTGNSYVYDQRDRAWRDATAAGDFLEGRPLIRNLKYAKTDRPRLPAPEELAARLPEVVATYNSRGFAKPSAAVPPLWRHEHWPPDMPYTGAERWHEKLRALEPDDPTFLTPFERPEPIHRAFGDEFWVYKQNDGERDFGFFVETMSSSCYGPWLGGSLQTFWTRPTGIVLLAAHDKTGDEVDQRENTRVWSQIDTWATHHIWGRDEKGIAVSTAVDITDNKVRHELDRKPLPLVEVISSLVRGPAPGDADTNGKVIATTKIATQFEALPDGLRINHAILLGESEQYKELWCTLPVFLRNAAQTRLADTTIEYKGFGGWKTLDATLTETTNELRFGREFDAGPQYVYVRFDTSRRVKLSEEVWQASYQSRNRIRNVHIDVHGKPGVAQTLPNQWPSLFIKTWNRAR